MAARTKKAQVFRRRFGEGDLPDEPKLDSVSGPADFRLVAALNYYNLVDMKDKKDVLRKWIIEYMDKAGFTQAERRAVSRMEDWRVTSNMGAISRLILRGLKLPPESVENHHARIRDAASRWEAADAEKQVAKAAAGPAKDATFEAFLTTKGDVEDMWDAFYYDGAPVDAYAYLHEKGVSAKVASMVRDSFSKVLADFVALQAGEPDMKEAFPGLKRARVNKIVEQAESIVRDCDRYASNQKKAVVRKPRKRKEKSAADLTKGMTYLKDYQDLKLVSVDPAFIVGARQVWLYSVKYKTLRQLVGNSLTVKGSTIHGWDPLQSCAKTLRKPEKVLAEVLSGTSVSVKKIMPALKTKPMVLNGRVNGETIIVRAMK